MKNNFYLIAILFLSFTSCKKDKTEDQPASTPDPYASQKQQVKQTYADIAFAVYDDSYIGAINLKTAINNFVANPSAINLTTAQQAWLDVREVYGQTEAYRFADGPIDNTADGPEGFINAWPMDESYVDYVVGSPTSGIVNDSVTYPVIDAATLFGANENGSEENIALGFHAIEFLLWGQDLSSTTAGTRPYTDYLTVGGTASHQQRRGEYLNLTVDILVAGLKQVRDEWDPAISGNYRTEFLAMDNFISLRKIFNSLKVLSGFELAGERMYTAYTNQDQEDEHSCFSDNTHRDIALNAKGIKNVYMGTYTRTNLTIVSGFSLRDLVILYNATKNTAVENALTDSETKISLMYIPFDQAIVLSTERPKVYDAVLSLQDEALKIKDAALAVGIAIP